MDILKIKCNNCTEKFSSSPISSSGSMFLDLCTSTGALIKYISNLIKEENFPNEKCNTKMSFILNFNQMICCLEFMLKIIREENEINSVLNECRKIASNRMNFCLAKLEEYLSENNGTVYEFGQFLKWMDKALDHIGTIDIDIDKPLVLTRFSYTKPICEDILTHAMSIAQICLDDDRRIIEGSCRSVLDVFNDLEIELKKNKPNKSMVSLFVEDISNKLCSVERKVDIAVLRLSLFIFAKYCSPLDNLYNFCEINRKTDYDKEELNNIIFEFDLHVDRMFQIGLFAVFCSSNIKSGIRIKNCMASLEFLETELVPAMRMCLHDCSAIQRVSTLVYKNYWITEANKLKNLVYEIIDPSAFCKVIYDEITFKVDKISEEFDETNDFSKSMFNDIFYIGNVLVEFLLTVVKIESITNEEFKDGIRKCNMITSEIGSAIHVLDDKNVVTNTRLLKRCRVLQSQVKKFLLISKQNKETNNEKETEKEEFLLVPSEEKENMVFSQIIYKGKEILENRSIMYRTPKKSFQIYVDSPGDEGISTHSQKNLSISNLNFSFQSLGNKSSPHSMNIEDIFENLNELASSVLK